MYRSVAFALAVALTSLLELCTADRREADVEAHVIGDQRFLRLPSSSPTSVSSDALNHSTLRIRSRAAPRTPPKTLADDSLPNALLDLGEVNDDMGKAIHQHNTDADVTSAFLPGQAIAPLDASRTFGVDGGWASESEPLTLRDDAEDLGEGWLDPDPKAVSAVATWASEIAGGGASGAKAAAEIHVDPGEAANTLRRLAGKARMESDGVDRDRQSLLHILELLFEERGKRSEISLTKSLIRQIADDFATLNRLRTLEPAALTNATLGSETDNLVHYFRGLKTASMHGDSMPALVQSAQYSSSKTARPRRAVIFTCSFGDGHTSAAEAVSSYLTKGGFETQVVDTTSDKNFKGGFSSLLGIGPTFFFNEIVLKRQWYQLHNMFDKLGSMFFGRLVQPCPSPGCNNPHKDAFRAVLLESRPDLIVTVYHMDLLPILEVAKDLGNLPVMHIATDMDTKMSEVFGHSGPAVVYPRFLCAVPFSVTQSYSTISPLSMSRTFLSGFPVREAFLQPMDAQQVAAERAKLVPPGTKVLLVMSGGIGQDVPWPELLAAQGFEEPLHVIVVVGKNGAFARRLSLSLPKRVAFPGGRMVWQGQSKSVTVEVAQDLSDRALPAGSGIGPSSPKKEMSYYLSSERLASLMDVADAVVTKPGGSTSAEIAYRGLPAVFDATPGLLHWEEFTVRIFEEMGRGARFTEAEELLPIVREAMKLKRELVLAEDPQFPGHTIDSRKHILAAAEQLLSTPCKRCPLFPKEVEEE